MSPGVNDKSKMSDKEKFMETASIGGIHFSNGADGAEEIKALLFVVNLNRLLCSQYCKKKNKTKNCFFRPFKEKFVWCFLAPGEPIRKNEIVRKRKLVSLNTAGRAASF